jgi:coenzyme F420-0:L-glutamate ligase / coenzyme F420-1:gamma-L-glutamate ligase
VAILILPIAGLPAVRPGDDLADLLASAIEAAKVGVKPGDALVVCQKVVSKAEGRVVALDGIEPSALARSWAERHDKDARLIELVLRESTRIVRMDGGNLIVETGPGWVCANAGIDESNAVADGTATLLPLDPDASAEALRGALRGHLGVDLAVVVTDTFGRPWREGQVEVALGVAGMAPVLDLRGSRDLNGHELRVTVLGIADELACAAGLVMGKADGIAAALIRGYTAPPAPSPEDAAAARGGRGLIRRRENDLFR